jgi:mannose-6-phosphate isomerase-like protein (cupin superfamily)
MKGRFIIIESDIPVVELDDAGGKNFGEIEEFTSISQGAKKGNIVQVTLFGPDILHHHKIAEETYVSQGQGLIYLDGMIYNFAPGTRILIGPGVVHAARPKKGCIDLVFLCMSVPAFDPKDVYNDPRGRKW